MTAAGSDWPLRCCKHWYLLFCWKAYKESCCRTLTPFGFQAEERTLWEAADTYIRMSPYLQAHKIKNPMLLIHGEDDNNTGGLIMHGLKTGSL